MNIPFYDRPISSYKIEPQFFLENDNDNFEEINENLNQTSNLTLKEIYYNFIFFIENFKENFKKTKKELEKSKNSKNKKINIYLFSIINILDQDNNYLNLSILCLLIVMILIFLFLLSSIFYE